MAWLEEYEFGRTYYSIMDIQLTEAEGEWMEGKREKGKSVEPYEFESVLTEAEKWNSDYLLCNAGKRSFEDLPEQPEGYQYWVKIDGLYGELPELLSPRERDIMLARKIHE